MRSRLLIGASAWLLGAVSATAGSLYAVDQLGQGLFAQHTKQVSVAMVNAELAQDGASRPAQTPSPSPTATPRASHSAHKVRPATTHRAAKPVTRNASKLLTSAGGTAVASCRQAGAYLLYWSPAQGFETHDFVRGPSSVASVTFSSNSGEVVLRVTCSSSGVPTPHVSTNSWGGAQHDE
ncbi:MAG TPA: hypothetical protein VMU94_13480 [Streptosporangiaceae bacterium]|nr:hypothetical protein [Streptosporangiaceae bacterium]